MHDATGGAGAAHGPAGTGSMHGTTGIDGALGGRNPGGTVGAGRGSNLGIPLVWAREPTGGIICKSGFNGGNQGT